jgi:hypothetical protein
MNKRKLLCILLALGLLLLSGCRKETRTVACDGCGQEITLDTDSKITEDWIVFCKTCEQELFGGTGVVDGQ